ncbi:MAG: phenylalanine--tRNA ligase subunit beta [Candidatus Omnitrophica bacterium]|nr:phenylalanine--tRNA ligase subunit beta [Candidatus Omnitrophota bacterium]
MRFSLNFIREMVPVSCEPRELARKITLLGLEVENLEPVGDDWVYEVEVTSNRYDWLSMVGLSREVAAALGTRISLEYPEIRTSPSLEGFILRIDAPDDCPWYLGRRITNVRVKESSARLKERLLHSGLPAVNNVVDATNYCMLKWGTPLHAFDADKIQGNVTVRYARDRESFVGIDGKTRTLSSQNLVIADAERVIALAGVMGAQNTEVTGETKNVFLEAALFAPVRVRRSRRAAGIESESSYRFERSVFPDYIEYASEEAARIIERDAQGEFAGCVCAGRKPEEGKKEVILAGEDLRRTLGVQVPEEEVEGILSSLGFSCRRNTPGTLTVTVPAFRLDVDREEDLYEEIIRVYGYERIPATLPPIQPGTGKESLYSFKQKIRVMCAQLGFQEVVTYSIGEEDSLRAVCERDPVTLVNPLRAQETALRTTLFPALLQVLRYNRNRSRPDLSIFELADRYGVEKTGFSEIPTLAFLVSGQREEFFTLKGALREICGRLNIADVEFREITRAHFSSALELRGGGTVLGWAGKAGRKECDAQGVSGHVFYGEVDVEALQARQRPLRFVPFSQYPAVSRDVSLIIRPPARFQQVRVLIERRAGSYLEGLLVVDRYTGKEIPADAQAVTVRISYQSREKTLTSEEVDALHTGVREELQNQTGILVR